MTRELDAEGAKQVVVVTDEPEKYDGEISARLAAACTVHHRDELDAVQRELREIAGLHRDRSTTRPAPPRSAGAGSAARMAEPGQARRHQRAGLRRLRRLLGAEQLPVGRAARDRVRPQAPHQPEHLQQGLLLREGLLPELRHGRRRPDEEREEGSAERPDPYALPAAARAGAAASPRRRGASSSPASAAPASSPSASCSAWRRTSKARASSRRIRPASRRRAARPGATSRSRTGRTRSSPPRSAPPRPTS